MGLPSYESTAVNCKTKQMNSCFNEEKSVKLLAAWSIDLNFFVVRHAYGKMYTYYSINI